MVAARFQVTGINEIDRLREASTDAELDRALDEADAYVDAHKGDDALEPLMASIHMAIDV